MPEVKLDGHGRLPVPEEIHDRYGDRYRIVDLGGTIELIPVSDEPLAELREEFEGIDATSEELRERARNAGMDLTE